MLSKRFLLSYDSLTFGFEVHVAAEILSSLTYHYFLLVRIRRPQNNVLCVKTGGALCIDNVCVV